MATTETTATDRITERLTLMKDDPAKPYLIRYRIEEGRYGKDDAGDNEGLTQNLIYISCITQPDGGYSQTWRGIDGATGRAMHHADVFKAWILMAASLREKEDLHPGTRQFLDEVFEAWRAA